jgi:DivIVA domain-containing protein
MGPPQGDDIFHPEFAVVLRGYDPEEVRAYVLNVANHIEGLQRQVDELRDQIDEAHREAAAAKEAAYHQLGSKMADLLHAADGEAERLRRDGAEEARRRTAEAQQQADRTMREAEENADEVRRRGEEMLARAKAETERVLGGLSAKRDEMLRELEGTRARLSSLLSQLEGTIAATQQEASYDEAAVGQVTAEAESTMREIHGESVAPASDLRQTDELLESVEGFDLVMPDVRIDEDGGVTS